MVMVCLTLLLWRIVHVNEVTVSALTDPAAHFRLSGIPRLSSGL